MRIVGIKSCAANDSKYQGKYIGNMQNLGSSDANFGAWVTVLVAKLLLVNMIRWKDLATGRYTLVSKLKLASSKGLIPTLPRTAAQTRSVWLLGFF